MRYLLYTITALFCALKMQAAIHTETVDYQDGGTTLEGFLAYDDSISGKRPGVLVVHQWHGVTDYEKMRAQQLAQTRIHRVLRGHLRQGDPPANTAGFGRGGRQIQERPEIASRARQRRLGTIEAKSVGRCQPAGGDWLLFWRNNGAGTRPQRRAIERRGQLSRRIGFAEPGRRQKHQVQGARAGGRG